MREWRRKEFVLKALANYRRLLILKMLLKGERLSVSQISDRLNLSFKSTSKHLSILQRTGLISKSQKGLWCLYFIERGETPRVKRILDSI